MAIAHAPEFRVRRFLNWFPLGLTYALLYMGRYNLTVAKTSLSAALMTKEDFGIIFAAGTFVYFCGCWINGPIVDRAGGRKGMLTTAIGSAIANLAMGAYLRSILVDPSAPHLPLRLVFSALYAVNMYFQSFGALSILKVNVHWFHISERGGFSGIFGTMISSGIFFAFTINGLLLKWAGGSMKSAPEAIVFFVPALLLLIFAAIEFFLLRDRPSQAGHQDFDTGDASSGDTSSEPLPTREIWRRLLTNPIVITIGAIELCTGVVRQGVMQWFPVYAAEVWALPITHHLAAAGDIHWNEVLIHSVVGALLGFAAGRFAKKKARGFLVTVAGLVFLVPFLEGGWGGLLFVAGVIGGNVAGWVSDIFFQSRRGPAAAGLYALLALLTLGMIVTLAPPTNDVEAASPASGLRPGDRIVRIADRDVGGWADVRAAVACWEPDCKDSGWDAKECTCSTSAPRHAAPHDKTIPATIVRDGASIDVQLPDPKPSMRAGETRLLKDVRPKLPMSPYVLGALVFLMSLCLIGTHGLLSGTATIDFGGRKAAATAGGMIDGCVYLGSAIQGLSLGFLTTKSWSYWPPFLLPFTVVGFVLCLRIWNAKPKAGGGH